MTQLTETLPGVWFWEQPHPDWEAGDSWDQMVRCWVLRTPVGLVLVDPLMRDDADGTEAWSELDALIAAHGPAAGVIRLLHYHHRSAAQASARYDVPIYARPLPRDSIPVHPFDDPTRDGGELLGGLVAHHVSRDDEIVLWIPSARALLFADVGRRTEAGFDLCPEHWVAPPDSWSELRTELDVLADLEPEHLLVSHGRHALGDGAALGEAVTRASDRPLPPFIDLADLALRRDTWKLLDARLYLDGRSEREAYDAAHLVGATFLDFHATLSDPPGEDASRGRHPLPSPERFAAGLRAAGINDGDTVVAYDDQRGVTAARLIWLLRILGVDAALVAPIAKDDWVSEPTPAPEPGDFGARPWPADRFADIDAVAARDPETVLLDARDPARYAGGTDPVDPRPGHIPGAVNLPCRANVTPDGQLIGRPELLDRLNAALGDSDDVISSCGSGVTACHNLLTLESFRVMGRLYVGSFSEWSRDGSREVATGDSAG